MEKFKSLSFARDALSRRAFLQVGSLTFLGIGLRQYLEARSLLPTSKGKAEACILLWLEGGPSQMDTWDPKPSSGFKPISTNVPGVQISELFPRVAKRMDKLAVIRSMKTELNNHIEATGYAMTSHLPSPAVKFPSWGSVVSKEMGARNQIPPYVVIPEWQKEKIVYEALMSSGFLDAGHNPMLLPDPSLAEFNVPDLSLPKSLPLERLEHRRSCMNALDKYYREKVRSAEHAKMDTFAEQALNMLLTPAVKDAFDLTKEKEKTKEAYGSSRFGQSVLLARRLVEAGARFVTARGYDYNVWDTHSDNEKSLRDKLAPPLDQALSALLDDLGQRGLLESTVVIVMGEFGRTPEVNSGKGRDHWNHCWSVVLGGGGIQGGQIVGASDERGAYVADRVVTLGDLYATVYKALGIDWTKTYDTPVGRPVYIANSTADTMGTPLQELA